MGAPLASCMLRICPVLAWDYEVHMVWYLQQRTVRHAASDSQLATRCLRLAANDSTGVAASALTPVKSQK
jgi:hypothetical protein